MTRRQFLAASVLATHMKNPAPAPYGILPSERQLRWHTLEYYGFLHFTTNTFTDREWGYGDEDPAVFAPTDFDADRIAAVAHEVGLRGLILTAKHHDGFCLWPTKTTTHNVTLSPFRDGKGDVVREMADACRRHRVKFGVYLSPWDRNHPHYGEPKYVDVYREQLRELLTNYGELFEIWHDGANGGDGYYGGVREKRQIDRRTYYGWEETWAMARELQPNAVIFSDVGPDIRWVGNENGIAGEPCWATYDPVGEDGGPPAPGYTRWQEAPQGHRNRGRWLPAECDVSIRPGWFWHESENDRVRTPENLLDLYFRSVGRGGSLLLNIPPDRRGHWHENDVAALRGFKKLRDSVFGRDLARTATATASHVRAGDRRFDPRNLLNGKPDTYWTTDDDASNPTVTLTLKKPAPFNVVRLREYLPLGQRVDTFAIDIRENDGWKEVAQAEGIGSCRMVRIPTVTVDQVRLRIVKAAACPALTEFGLFAAP
ncbi:MAG: alpha-L-fucosidase [Capsulimonadales bacterium]|nr:alpha-L-fucosidase [Capsulimonadales bacterium]